MRGKSSKEKSTLGSSLYKVVKENQFGFKLIPNIRDFTIRLANDEELFKFIGISIKQPSKLTFKP